MQLRAGAAVRSQQTGPGKRIHSCSLCHKIFRSSQRLSSHLTCHDGRRVASVFKVRAADKKTKHGSKLPSNGAKAGCRLQSLPSDGKSASRSGETAKAAVRDKSALKPHTAASRNNKPEKSIRNGEKNSLKDAVVTAKLVSGNKKELPAENGLQASQMNSTIKARKSGLASRTQRAKSVRNHVVLRSDGSIQDKAASVVDIAANPISQKPPETGDRSEKLSSVSLETNPVRVTVPTKKPKEKVAAMTRSRKSDGKANGAKLPSLCMLCKRSFATKSSLYRHNRRHHPDGSTMDRNAVPRVIKKASVSCESRTKARVFKKSRLRQQKQSACSVDSDIGSALITVSGVKVEIDFSEFVKTPACSGTNGSVKKRPAVPTAVSSDSLSKKSEGEPRLPDAKSKKQASKTPAKRRRRECEICKDTFSSTSSLKRHIQRFHTAKKVGQTDKGSAVTASKVLQASLPSLLAPSISNGDHSGTTSTTGSPQSTVNSPAEFSTGSATPVESSASGSGCQPYYLCWTPRPVFKTASVAYRGKNGGKRRPLPVPANSCPPSNSLSRVNSVAESSSGSCLASPVSAGPVPASHALSFVPATELSQNPFEMPWERKLLPPDVAPCCPALIRRTSSADFSIYRCRLMGQRVTASGESALLVWD